MLYFVFVHGYHEFFFFPFEKYLHFCVESIDTACFPSCEIRQLLGLDSVFYVQCHSNTINKKNNKEIKFSNFRSRFGFFLVFILNALFSLYSRSYCSEFSFATYSPTLHQSDIFLISFEFLFLFWSTR